MKNKMTFILGAALICAGAQASKRGAYSAAGNNVRAAAFHLSDVGHGQWQRSKSGVVGLYDKSTNTFKAIFTGKSATGVVNALNHNSASIAKGSASYAVNTATDAVVLAGDTVDFIFRTTFGFAADSFKNTSGQVVVLDLGGKTQNLTSQMTSAVKDSGTHVLSWSGSLVTDSVGLVEDSLSGSGNPLWIAGEFVWGMPERIAGLFGLSFR